MAGQLWGAMMLGLAVAAGPAWAEGVVGNWSTETGRGVIAIAPCGEAVCGRIVGVTRDPGEKMPTDNHGAPQCGLVIIRDAKPQPDGSWHGEITDPRNGTVYGAILWVDGSGNLLLRGYLGMPLLGKTQTWHPYTGHLSEACEMT